MARNLAWWLVFAGSIAPVQWSAAAPGDAAESAELRYMNRAVYTMRVPVAGATPELRAERALQRLRALPLESLKQPVERATTLHDDERAIALKLGGETLLTVFKRDLDPDTGATLDGVATESARALDEAFAARRALHDPQRLARGLAGAMAGLPVVGLIAWLTWWLRSTVTRQLQRLVQAEAATHRILGLDWSNFGLRAVTAITGGLGLAVVGVLGIVWTAHALRQFPATIPLSERLWGSLIDTLFGLIATLWGALPDLATIAMLVLVARGAVWLVDQMFRGVVTGRLRLSGLHPETARATRRLVVFAIWGLALAAGYPYIPGSDSAVFRGLSVFLGAMFTLGSSGVVSQWMHGLVIVYARALRVGDFVRCGNHEGVVQELNALSVKMRDAAGNEVTLPNGAVVQGAIINHSRHASAHASRGTVRLSLGYDVPWRQVHALLLEAASRTEGLSAHAAPRVLDRVLGNFAIEYDLVVEIADARRHALTLASLIHAIRDVFESEHVEIVSPEVVNLHGTASAAGAPAARVADAPSAPGRDSTATGCP